MLQAFYSATVGAQQQMLRMDVQANNISNVNTNGFKAQVPAFQALMYGMLDGIDNSQLPRGSGAYMSGTATNWEEGTIQQTDRNLDYAILGDGYFALYDAATGEVSFTRDGAFTLAGFQEATGQTDENGQPIMDTVYYLSDGEGRQVFTIQYKDGLQREGSSRFLMGDKNGLVWVSDSKVQRGMLETSNTDLATELSQVIEAQRSYSYVLKMMQTADEVETTINGLPNG